MAFVDNIEIFARAGKGGNGVERWLHEKFKEFSGPSGGDGGKGGDVYLEAVEDIAALSQYIFVKRFEASNGEHGERNSRHGKGGKDYVIKVPVGSIVTNTDTGEVIQFLTVGQKELILVGGDGGFGNEHFKSANDQQPKTITVGKRGQEGHFRIELEIIADVGLVGLPNAGKSSLLNTLTGAHSKVAAYQFTTLEPHLGAMGKTILADIPGLIEGAAEGKGLGDKFLRHIKRTRVIIHLVSVENENMKQAYEIIRKELEDFDPKLISKKEIIVLSKSDLVLPEEIEKKKKEIGADLAISIEKRDSLEQLKNAIRLAL